MGVYVMTTLRFFFHMGSVECVTFHEPDSHFRAGGGMDGEGSVEGRLEGARRVIMLGAGRRLAAVEEGGSELELREAAGGWGVQARGCSSVRSQCGYLVI